VGTVLVSLEGAGASVAERRLGAGEPVYERGESASRLHFLREGVVRVYKRFGGHAEAVVTILGEGELFGEPGLHEEEAHRDSAEALTPCRIATVGKAALRGHLRRDPRCALALLVAYSRWIQRREEALARLLPRQVRPRLAASLLELAGRFGEPEAGGSVVVPRVTHQLLADTIASKRENVSKEAARFRREGLIESRGRGRIAVLDGPGLAEIASRGDSKTEAMHPTS
jgi:CRP/FNR family transcriptional regulator, cyclic AMP receptor protein